MKLPHPLPLVFALLIISVPAWAAKDDEHQAHHPAGVTTAPSVKAAPAKTGNSMAQVDAQMKSMGAMHDRMMAAKTPEERSALMPEHMKAMQEGMEMMNGMATRGMAGMKGDMAAHHQMMESRMAMMQATMQMMMDRLPAAPAN